MPITCKVPLVLASLFLQAAPTAFQFAKEQRVYVIAVDATSRDLSATRADLGLERAAKDYFKKANIFRVAKTLRDSDFVFFVMLDAASVNYDEVALAVLPADYERAGSNLDTLRNSALWQGDSHFKPGRNAALVGATMGVSAIFHRPSVIKDLVKQFHEDVIGKQSSPFGKKP